MSNSGEDTSPTTVHVISRPPAELSQKANRNFEVVLWKGLTQEVVKKE